MSRRDFEAIALILAGDLASAGTPSAAQKVIGITHSLADYFLKANPRFDRARFYKAVGI